MAVDDEPPPAMCVECGQVGRIGIDLVITGLGHLVHHGECHKRLWRYLERSALALGELGQTEEEIEH